MRGPRPGPTTPRESTPGSKPGKPRTREPYSRIIASKPQSIRKSTPNTSKKGDFLTIDSRPRHLSDPRQVSLSRMSFFYLPQIQASSIASIQGVTASIGSRASRNSTAESRRRF